MVRSVVDPAVNLCGELLATGSRSNVHAWGDNMIAKVPYDSTPPTWIEHEARFTAAVRRAGMPAHGLVGLSYFAGKQISIYERVEGPTLWSLVLSQPNRAPEFGETLAKLHVRLVSAPAPISLPRQVDRLSCKLRQGASQRGIDWRSTLDQLTKAPASGSAARPMQLCHGDFHPANVIVSDHGPIVVDWFDACRGDAAGDVGRTSLLLGSGDAHGEVLQHLPHSDATVLCALHDAYLHTVSTLLDIELGVIEKWRRLQAAARLAEGLDEAAMLAIWSRPANQ